MGYHQASLIQRKFWSSWVSIACPNTLSISPIAKLISPFVLELKRGNRVVCFVRLRRNNTYSKPLPKVKRLGEKTTKFLTGVTQLVGGWGCFGRAAHAQNTPNLPSRA